MSCEDLHAASLAGSPRGGERIRSPFYKRSPSGYATPMRLYLYEKCDTCRKAAKWLDARNIPYTAIPIRDQPPTIAELKTMLSHVGELRRLFNTSGADYKAMNMKALLPNLSESEALAFLAANGNLVKRPFAICKNAGTTGFVAETWERLFG